MKECQLKAPRNIKKQKSDVLKVQAEKKVVEKIVVEKVRQSEAHLYSEWKMLQKSDRTNRQPSFGEADDVQKPRRCSTATPPWPLSRLTKS